MSSYASRYSQRATTGGIDPRTKSPTVGRAGSNVGATATMQQGPKATGRGSWSMPVGQRRNSTPSSIPTRSARGAPSSRQGINQNNEMLVSAVSQKLRGFQELRHLMQNLADRHKKEETELQTLMKKLLVVRGPQSSAQHTQSPKSSALPTVALSSGASADELQRAIDDRDKAIAMLSLFREEGNTVMQRMHDSLRHAHVQHEELLGKVEKLTIENARLRFVVREVRYFADDLAAEENPADEPVTASVRQNAAAKETIAKLDELLMEADAVIISLRAQNEELLRQNESLRLRERRGQQQQPHHHHSNHHQESNSDAASEPNSDVLNIDLAKADDESIAAFVDGLKQQLRTEKRQRLEAEELSHKLLIEHQKNVLLLEQRLMQRNMVGTPRSGTPRKPFNNKASSVGQPMALDSHAASSSPLPSVGPKQRLGSAGSVHVQQRLDEEVELLLSDSPNAGAEVSYTHSDDREAMLVPHEQPSPPDLHPTFTRPSPPDQPQASQSDEHEQHIAELRTIEAQLKEVVESLEES